MSHPVITFDWKEMPHIADNIWQAQMAGWERVLTYRGPLPHITAREIRGNTMGYDVAAASYTIPTFPKGHVNHAVNSRDEYPFACTEEGASRDGKRKPWVGDVPPTENCQQGGMLRAFLLRNGITMHPPNNRFEVQVINHPKGPVRP